MKTAFFTGNGDKGKSGFGKKKFSKDDSLFYALGALDTLNSLLGWCAVEAIHAIRKKKTNSFIHTLHEFQEMLFIAQAEVAAIGFGIKSTKKITHTHIAYLEKSIKDVDIILPSLTQFIVPGGGELSTRLDIARASARDAERAIISFHRSRKCSPELLAFMNRFSSALFALARLSNHVAHIRERHPSY
ncbi:MAG: cob(I)yrinic acid a,c-diamide adenosyltransferase [Candidatus Paceibacterota bacterium]|jgi:cob(I)alamin adenosyltransferase